MEERSVLKREEEEEHGESHGRGEKVLEKQQLERLQQGLPTITGALTTTTTTTTATTTTTTTTTTIIPTIEDVLLHHIMLDKKSNMYNRITLCTLKTSLTGYCNISLSMMPVKVCKR